SEPQSYAVASVRTELLGPAAQPATRRLSSWRSDSAPRRGGVRTRDRLASANVRLPDRVYAVHESTHGHYNESNHPLHIAQQAALLDVLSHGPLGARRRARLAGRRVSSCRG